MKYLFIHFPLDTTLPAESLRFSYFVRSGAAAVTSSGTTLAADLPRLVDHPVIVVLPVQNLAWHAVDFPKGVLRQQFLRRSSPQKILDVLEGLLEDKLLDSPEQLHFALSPQAAHQSPAVVAVCDRNWLAAGLKVLTDAGIKIAQVVPEFFPLAHDSSLESSGDEVYLLETDEQPRVVQVGEFGVNSLPLNAHTSKLIAITDCTKIYAESKVTNLAMEYFSRDAAIVDVHQRFFLAQESGWDMAQFDLLGSAQSVWKRGLGQIAASFWQERAYRPARIMLATVIVVNLVGLNATAFLANYQVKQAQKKSYQILRTTFPSVTTVVDVPIQMKRSLESLIASGGQLSGGDLEAILNAYGEISQGNLSEPTAMEYSKSGHQLKLKNLRLSDEKLKAFNQVLASNGYEAKSLDSDVVITKRAT